MNFTDLCFLWCPKWPMTARLLLFVSEVGDFGALTVTVEAGILETFNELIRVRAAWN